MAKLTDFERQVLTLASNGRTIKETAIVLGKTLSTIKTQRHNVTIKLNANNFIQALVSFEREKYLEV